jgi:hypothetical protein
MGAETSLDSPLGSADAAESSVNPFQGLYERAARDQWLPEGPLDWKQPVDIDPKLRTAWARAVDVVYALEFVGLDVVARMSAPITARLDDPHVRLYLGVQVADEARHVTVLERYLTQHLKAESEMKTLAKFYAYFANPAIYRTEGWFFSTIFSENTASQFMKMAGEIEGVDSLGRDMFKRFHKDEGRHLRFLHLALPAVARTMTRSSKVYVRAQQKALFKFAFSGIKGVAWYCKELGMDGDELIDRIIHALETQYRQMGIDEFVKVSDTLPSRRQINSTL